MCYVESQYVSLAKWYLMFFMVVCGLFLKFLKRRTVFLINENACVSYEPKARIVKEEYNPGLLQTAKWNPRDFYSSLLRRPNPIPDPKTAAHCQSWQSMLLGQRTESPFL